MNKMKNSIQNLNHSPTAGRTQEVKKPEVFHEEDKL